MDIFDKELATSAHAELDRKSRRFMRNSVSKSVAARGGVSRDTGHTQANADRNRQAVFETVCLFEIPILVYVASCSSRRASIPSRACHKISAAVSADFNARSAASGLPSTCFAI